GEELEECLGRMRGVPKNDVCIPIRSTLDQSMTNDLSTLRVRSKSNEIIVVTGESLWKSPC
uniref:Uncharacterized protein n=1 Tax=Maylandia zebra TaxID=106582 RepID=A0A3P9CU56_9CICH